MALITQIPTGGGSAPTTVDDHFTPRIIVGNALSGDPALGQLPPFQYIQDAGDGAGITTALAAAASGYDVYIRPGTYTLPVGTHFTIPDSVRVRGAPGGANGLGGTIIVASAGDGNNTQDVFILGTASALEDIQIRVPAGANGGLAGSAIVLVPSVATRIARVYIDMTFGGTAQRNTPLAFWSGSAAAPGTDCTYEDCEVLMPTAVSSVSPGYIGFVQGFVGVDSVVATGRGPRYRGCISRGGQAGFAAFNVAAPTYDNCIVDALPVNNSTGFWYLVETTATTPVEGPAYYNPRVFISTVGDSAGTTAIGIMISNATTGQVSVTIQDWIITGQQIVFAQGAGQVGARQGLKIRIEDAGTGQVNRGVIGPGVVDGAQIGVFMQSLTNDNTTGAAGSINDVMVTGVQGRGFTTYGAFVGQGASLDIQNVTQPKINRVSFVGCDFSGAAAGEDGIAIDAGVTNTIISSNQLTPNGGTAINDLGTTTQIIGNITT